MANLSDIIDDGGINPQRRPLYIAPLPEDAATGLPVIRKVFIANRGEIACRIIATCRKLNIQTSIIYVQECVFQFLVLKQCLLTLSSRDENSPHVLDATDAVYVGSLGELSLNPFLDVDLLVRTALDTGADAVHPGYGYLSENSDFATRVKSSGMIFIGPSPKYMSTLGDKRSSKEHLRYNLPTVPLIPGYSGSSLRIEDLKKEAANIGYPVMLKASAGGGGKGIRVVKEPSQLKDELARAQSEASRFFGSSDCILEKYIESSKHVEVQIMGDGYGNVVSFFERDCSVQRRHQKVIEESPCIFLTNEVRQRMRDTAESIARAIGYENAGTVEFIVDVSTSDFFFLEVNARLQVEHPVTEEVAGVDLVALQLFVASGGNLKTLKWLSSIRQTGHAIECRLCAEDPQKDFIPQHGTVYLWRPADHPLDAGRDVRYETALRSGSSVSIYFDSMIAKLVVWAPTRTTAIRKMIEVLANTACIGIRTNQLFLQNCLRQPEFQDPSYNTSFISRHIATLLWQPSTQKCQTTRQSLAIMSNLALRSMNLGKKRALSAARPFQTIQPNFRNQKYDCAGVRCDVLQLGRAENISTDTNRRHILICRWSPSSGAATSDNLSVELLDLSSADSEDWDTGSGALSQGFSPAKALAAQYNHINNLLSTPRSPSTSQTRVILVSCHEIESDFGSGRSNSLFIATVCTSINNVRITAHCVVPKHEGDGNRNSQRVLCHFPHLGTFLEAEQSSLLGYIESCRVSEDVAVRDNQKAIVAPMPCKILSILKKNGDQVTVGDVVLVIESMKMEVSIKASRTGIFETACQVGTAVEEGKVLCQIS